MVTNISNEGGNMVNNITQSEVDDFFNKPPEYDAEFRGGVAFPRIKINERAGDTSVALKVPTKDEYTGDTLYEHKEEVPVMILDITDSRVYFGDEAYNPDRRAVCWSDEGVMPNPAGTNPHRVAECRQCPLSQWVDGRKPACADQYNVVVYNLEMKEVQNLLLSGMNIKYGRPQGLGNVRFARPNVIGLRVKQVQNWLELDIGNIPSRQATPEEQSEIFNAWVAVRDSIPSRKDALNKLHSLVVAPPRPAFTDDNVVQGQVVREYKDDLPF